MYTFVLREKKIRLMSSSMGERKKMLENKNHWNNSSLFKCNIMHCTVNCWLQGEHGDKEWINNRGEGVNLIKTWYIQTWKTKVKSLGL
jgi:hypothetical protein